MRRAYAYRRGESVVTCDSQSRGRWPRGHFGTGLVDHALPLVVRWASKAQSSIKKSDNKPEDPVVYKQKGGGLQGRSIALVLIQKIKSRGYKLP